MTDGKKRPPLSDLFPQKSRLLLTGGGKEFVERIGKDAVKQVVLGVLCGENIRTQTEPLTRQRLGQVSGAMIALFANGWMRMDDFTHEMSGMAVTQLKSSNLSDKASVWPAQWILGLTGKSVQNVLRSRKEAMASYIKDFENAVRESARHCREDIGDLSLKLGYVADRKQTRELNWEDITRITTALGCAASTVRGSDKSIYGKLFERLVLGSVLTILGFRKVQLGAAKTAQGVFWLSDNSATREADATAIFEPGKLARFDIGFIGPGNSEISKDKLSRFERDLERADGKYSSKTFIVVDKLPETSKTKNAAQRIGAEIVQMSMRFWPRELAIRMARHFTFKHELVHMPDEKVRDYLAAKLRPVAIEEFLSGFSASELPNTEEENGDPEG